MSDAPERITDAWIWRDTEYDETRVHFGSTPPKRAPNARRYIRAPQWISVEDELPEDGTEALVYFPDAWGQPKISLFRAREWSITEAVSQNWTHWMPPPAPPEETP